LATRENLPVVVRGAGTGMTGGALTVQGGIMLVTSRLNHILEIDEENHLAVVEPGVFNGDLKKAVEEKGLFYRPDPASFSFCTLGGNVGECAGGPSALKYGVTRDYVLALEIVLADGRILHTGERTAKGVVGYDLTRLFVGSEGTLGIITKITLRLLPLPPEKKTLLVLSKSIEQSTSLVTKILRHHTPCTLEYMDATALGIVAEKLPFSLPELTKSLLLIELDGTAEMIDEQTKKLFTFLERENLLKVAVANGKEEEDNLWAARRAISPSSFSLKPHKMGEDIVVPRNKIPQLVSYAEQLAKEQNLIIFTFGHAGDGNIHVNIMLDKNNQQEKQRALVAKKNLFKKTIALGGTISGEHGVGITKAPFIHLEKDEVALDIMVKIKRSLDPLGILNPGKIFPNNTRST